MGFVEHNRDNHEAAAELDQAHACISWTYGFVVTKRLGKISVARQDTNGYMLMVQPFGSCSASTTTLPAPVLTCSGVAYASLARCH